MNIQQVKEGLERIGKCGFGKDASTGLGRFEVIKAGEIDLTKMGITRQTLVIPLLHAFQRDTYSDMFFTLLYGLDAMISCQIAKPI